MTLACLSNGNSAECIFMLSSGADSSESEAANHCHTVSCDQCKTIDIDDAQVGASNPGGEHS